MVPPFPNWLAAAGLFFWCNMPAYTQDDKNNIVWAVFVAMEGGKSLRHACRDEGISEATVLRWIDADETGEWSKQYTRARDGLLSHHANEILMIADSCDDAAKARVQIDSRKWILSRLLPKRFGERVVNENVGADGGPMQFQMIERRIVDPND